MIVTARRMPVPDPIAFKLSAIIVRMPIQMPPKAAAVGMYLVDYKKTNKQALLVSFEKLRSVPHRQARSPLSNRPFQSFTTY